MSFLRNSASISNSFLCQSYIKKSCKKAPVIKEFTVKGFEDVKAGIVKWPLSVIRLQCEDEKRIIDLAEHILNAWRDYTDEDAFIFAETDGEKHNTITPIARKRGDLFELDLALRNNITTEEHPLGVYHPHAHLHHIKKENIGLIEVMGLAVLPSRLKGEMEQLADYIVNGKDLRSNEALEKHADWVEEFSKNYDCIDASNVNETHKNKEDMAKVSFKTQLCFKPKQPKRHFKYIKDKAIKHFLFQIESTQNEINALISSGVNQETIFQIQEYYYTLLQKLFINLQRTFQLNEIKHE